MSLDGKKVYGALSKQIEAVDQKLDDAIVGIYSPGGSVAFASLPELTADVLGMVYEVTDDFTTDSRFKEGAGRSYPAGTNVAVINTGTNASPVYKFDATTGAIVVDDALSTTSKNPVQNKVVKDALDGKADLTDIAPAFNAERDYKVGDYVSYDGNIYRFKEAHSAGAWNAAHADQVTAAGQYVRAGLSTLSGRTMGVKATAEGYNNTPSGDYAHAEGESNFASAEAAHAEGLGNQSTAEAAHSEGESNFARGVASHAEGVWTEATGANGAHSEGYATLASGDGSHAGGHATIAQRAYQTVIGEFNVADTEGSHTYDKGDYAFIIGNGTGTNARSNALGVKWDGTHEINGDVVIGQHYDSTQSADVDSNLTVSGIVTVNGSDYAEKFEEAEACPVNRFVTLDGEKIRLAQPDDDYILGVTSEKPAIIGDKDNDGVAVGLIGKLWVVHDGSAKVNGFVVSGKNGIATDKAYGYRVMAVDGNRCKILVK